MQKVIYLTSIHIPLVKTSYMTTVRCKRAREYNLILCPRRRGECGFWQVPSASATHPISYPITSHRPGVGQMLMNKPSTLKGNEDDWIDLCGSQTLRWSIPCAPHFLVFIPLCNPFPLSVGGMCDLPPKNRGRYVRCLFLAKVMECHCYNYFISRYIRLCLEILLASLV